MNDRPSDTVAVAASATDRFATETKKTVHLASRARRLEQLQETWAMLPKTPKGRLTRAASRRWEGLCDGIGISRERARQLLREQESAPPTLNSAALMIENYGREHALSPSELLDIFHEGVSAVHERADRDRADIPPGLQHGGSWLKVIRAEIRKELNAQAA